MSGAGEVGEGEAQGPGSDWAVVTGHRGVVLH